MVEQTKSQYQFGTGTNFAAAAASKNGPYKQIHTDYYRIYEIKKVSPVFCYIVIRWHKTPLYIRGFSSSRSSWMRFPVASRNSMGPFSDGKSDLVTALFVLALLSAIRLNDVPNSRDLFRLPSWLVRQDLSQSTSFSLRQAIIQNNSFQGLNKLI